MVVTVKNAVFWDVTPCSSCKNRRHEAKRLFENMLQFKYLGTTVTNQTLDLGENVKETELWQCLLPFTPEPSAFLSAVVKHKN
jgi:hypothetical protein